MTDRMYEGGGAKVDPSWAGTEAGKATSIDQNAKVEETIDTATMPNYSRKDGNMPPGDKGVGKDPFYDRYSMITTKLKMTWRV